MNYTDNLQSLWKEAKNYLQLQKQYLKLDTAEKLSVLLSAIAMVAVCLILGMIALSFFVMAFAMWLANFVGGVWSFAIMGGAMLLIMAIVYFGRKRWIVQPLTRFVAGLFVSEDEEEDEQ